MVYVKILSIASKKVVLSFCKFVITHTAYATISCSPSEKLQYLSLCLKHKHCVFLSLLEFASSAIRDSYIKCSHKCYYNFLCCFRFFMFQSFFSIVFSCTSHFRCFLPLNCIPMFSVLVFSWGENL